MIIFCTFVLFNLPLNYQRSSTIMALQIVDATKKD